jgi:hypothetical protein
LAQTASKVPMPEELYDIFPEHADVLDILKKDSLTVKEINRQANKIPLIKLLNSANYHEFEGRLPEPYRKKLAIYIPCLKYKRKSA